MLTSNLNVNSKVSKKFLITSALTSSLVNTNICKPPLLELQGTTGMLFSFIISRYFCGLKFLYSGSISIAPNRAIPSSSQACIPIDLLPNK